jgi:dipeptidyl aminopeptidase/acylaminoacyl peptidase
MRLVFTLPLLLTVATAAAQPNPASAAPPSGSVTPITLEQAMADPDWIGPPVETAWWSWDGKRAIFPLKRAGSTLRDLYSVDIAGGATSKVADADRAGLDASDPVYDRAHRRSIFVRNGDVFLRDLSTGALSQLSRSSETESEPQFSADQSSVLWRVENNWYRLRLADHLLETVAIPKAEKDPAAPPDKADAMHDMQLRLIDTLHRQKQQRDAQREQDNALRRADPTRAAVPIYLGDGIAIDDTSLSPDGRWLVVATSPKGADIGRVGKLPKYVTESGYEEFEDERTRVGRNLPVGETLKLVDLADGSVSDLKFDALPGIDVDPLAALRKAAGKDGIKGNRPVLVHFDGDNSGSALHWSDDGRELALLVRAIDNKDRWIATVDFAGKSLHSVNRLTDPAWIGDFNDFGWMPDERTLWLLSEQSGYSHFYTLAPGGAMRQHTHGDWEASQPTVSADGRRAWFVCNRKSPGDYEVCALDLANDSLSEVTALHGVEDYTLSPDQSQLLVRYSSPYMPPQLAVVPAAGGEARTLTDTRMPDYKARTWIQPEFVQVPSTHGARPVWAKLYRPAQLEPGRKYPLVMFVHGAGYTQNVKQRFPYYFREQMFDNLLVQQGYLVLDMDYRGSSGYGRDWRTAIYRQMGHPELDDYIDGVHWMVAKQQGDPAHVGVYGGSYGGFMALMAMFRAPDTFQAGAALRPVSDWSTYNHEYTADILNTPDIDPEAYKISSPIEFADGLRGALLIEHGMMDDNVFFQDSVRLAQRLIELKKPDWSLAPFPLERHSFVQPDAWLDEYRRIDLLFERVLK